MNRQTAERLANYFRVFAFSFALGVITMVLVSESPLEVKRARGAAEALAAQLLACESALGEAWEVAGVSR